MNNLRKSEDFELRTPGKASKEIRLIYGHDIKNMTIRLLEDYRIEEKIPSKDSKIGLKPNLVVAVRPETGATTHTEIIEGIIEYLQKHGFTNISIIEGAWVGDSTKRGFRVNGYERFTERYGVPLYDTKEDQYVKKTAEGITMEISKRILDLDYMINLPVLKGHCQTSMTCALKNMKGCLSDRSKRLFHSLGLMRPIAALNEIVRPDLTLADSISGDLDFEEGGNPVDTGRLLLAEDPVLLDAYGAHLLGFSLDDVEYIPLAEEYGVGSADIVEAEVIELNKPEKSSNAIPTRFSKRISAYTAPDSACSCCYANLIHALKRMEENGTIHKLRGKKVAIGQGYKGKEVEIGVGACCAKAKHKVVKCPPMASEMMEMLENL